MTDTAAITETLHAYASAVDECRWDDAGACFTPAARADFGSLARGVVREGPEAIARFVARALGGFAATQHLVGTVQVHVQGDRASARSSVLATHVRDDAAAPFVVAGTYRDELERGADGWRIAKRHLELVWTRG